MNSEELETSLRTEFETYIKSLAAEMRQEAAEFQSRIESEFDRQKAQFSESLQGFVTKFDTERPFDAAFEGSVAEHLRLARDEGARITADAMVEAEKLGLSEPPPAAAVEVKYDSIRDAVDDICSKDSQSAILKSLVHHAAEFAPRGAFFIIKSEHLAGWKIFGTDDPAAESAIRNIHFPISSETILGSAIRTGATVAGSAKLQAGDAAFLSPLNFGEPDHVLSIPLVARGRAVAVLYADHGTDESSNLNREALETLVRVAGQTVELLASNQTAKSGGAGFGAADFEDAPGYPETPRFSDAPATAAAESYTPAPEYVTEAPPDPESDFDHTFQDAGTESQETQTPGFAMNDSVAFEGGFPQADIESASPFDSSNPFEAETPIFAEPIAVEEDVVSVSPIEDNPYATPAFGDSLYDQSRTQSFEPVDSIESAPAYEPVIETFEPATESFQPAQPVAEEKLNTGEMVFDTGDPIESAPPASSPFNEAADKYEPAGFSGGGNFNRVAEPVIEAPSPLAQPTRRSDRPVDLPIEVPEEERRIHNDARRFARLLVSEIKLYNEKKVIEGREAQDLYDRLREAIDRSREMYDKRVQPPVAAKFDYFHYELVNSLADGNSERLGAGYPGSNV